jgi:Ca2+/H+ antiporter
MAHLRQRIAFLKRVLVLLNPVIGGAPLTHVFSPMLVVAVALAVITVTVAIVDGEENRLEGSALIGLYGVIAAAFWWGGPAEPRPATGGRRIVVEVCRAS